MKLFFEIALGVNIALALFYAWAYLFRRQTWWPLLRAIFLVIAKG